jgi:hypothetical protein
MPSVKYHAKVHGRCGTLSKRRSINELDAVSLPVHLDADKESKWDTAGREGEDAIVGWLGWVGLNPKFTRGV